MATTLEHAYTRIYEVLCDGRGVARTLAAGYFKRGGPPGFLDAKGRSVRARPTPRIFAHISSGESIEGGPIEMGSGHLYEHQLVLLRDHWLGYQADEDAVEAALVRVGDDHMRIAAALCYPNNLAATEAAADTGIAGAGAVGRMGSRWEVVSVQALGRDGRLIQARDIFPLVFDYDPDG